MNYEKKIKYNLIVCRTHKISKKKERKKGKKKLHNNSEKKTKTSFSCEKKKLLPHSPVLQKTLHFHSFLRKEKYWNPKILF